jgi:glycosyltransferase involved in cell wall biosynthesis
VLTPYPESAAATRFRFSQMVDPLRERDIELAVLPLLSESAFARLYDRHAAVSNAVSLVAGAAKRVGQLRRVRRSDVVVVFREALLFGPPWVEAALTRDSGPSMVLDLDDATFVAYDSPTYGVVGRWLKWPGKTDALIELSALVTCGNRFVADYVEARARPTALVPTVVDTEVFQPRALPPGDVPVVGWVGSHSTFQYLEPLLPLLAEVRLTHPFRLKIVGSGRERVDHPGLDLDLVRWDVDSEVSHFQSLDIGLYPIPDDPWAKGKSGLKSIQYLACGVPFVASPVGVVVEIGQAGRTHLLASTPDEWRSALRLLLSDPDKRADLGKAGRAYSLRHYTLDHTADALAAALRAAASR